jgi:hypothetical protein
MMLDSCRDLCSLLRHWWTSDRIRVSPHEGLLLRIQPGDLITVAGVDAEVVGRSLIGEQGICLVCQTAIGPAELHVPIPPARNQLLWHISGVSRHVVEDDIKVWRRSV